MTAARALAAAAALAAALGASAARGAEIEIVNFSFVPAELAVTAGTRIVFVNRDQVPHSVIGSAGSRDVFRSAEQIDEDEAFTVLVSEPGSIALRCGLHSHMRGVIEVTPRDD
jgi:plastocyanin